MRPVSPPALADTALILEEVNRSRCGEGFRKMESGTMEGTSRGESQRITRRDTGKTSRTAIIVRFLAILGVPYWMFVMVFGFPFVPQIGELHPVWHEGWIETTVLFRLWRIILSIIGFHGGLGLALLWGWVTTNLAADYFYSGDLEAETWRRNGGDFFFDTLGWPFNPDSDEVSRRISPNS
jgi:hypothetical protein